MRLQQNFRRLTVALAVTALCVVAAACGSDGSDGSGSTGASDTSTSAGAPATAPNAASGVALEHLDVDLDAPIAAVPVPGSTSLLVAERGGTVVEVTLDAEGTATGSEPVVDITDAVGETSAERGLLDLAIDPDGSTLYLSYTRAEDGASQLEAYPLSLVDGVATVDTTDGRSLLDVTQPFPNHNGGRIVFGPDRMLYMALGDGGGGGDPNGNAQDRTSLLGKILRLDPSAAGSIPDDNPFVDGTDGERPEIWLTGVRNPWRFSFDSATGDLWVADVGQDHVEEISMLAAADGGGRGANLGWDLFEGNEEFEDSNPSPGAASEGPFTEPVLTYTHEDGGCSITGGVVYRGEAIPALQGAYLYSDFCTPGIQSVRATRAGDGRSALAAPLGVEVASVVSFTETEDGEVYVISLDDGLFRLVEK